MTLFYRILKLADDLVKAPAHMFVLRQIDATGSANALLDSELSAAARRNARSKNNQNSFIWTDAINRTFRKIEQAGLIDRRAVLLDCGSDRGHPQPARDQAPKAVVQPHIIHFSKPRV